MLGAVTKALPVSSDTASATAVSKPAGALSPVPTAVPPRASSRRPGSASSTIALSFSRLVRQPLISWARVMGTASCRWVRPLFTTSPFSPSSRRKVSTSPSMAGSSLSSSATAAAMCMAVGKVSLELWDMFTWSLGWSSFFPASSLPRLATTSFTFMLDWVPLPVCHTTSGKCPSSFPATTSSQARLIRPSLSSSSFPSLWLASAAAFFRIPKARTISSGIFSVPIWKF